MSSLLSTNCRKLQATTLIIIKINKLPANSTEHLKRALTTITIKIRLC